MTEAATRWADRSSAIERSAWLAAITCVLLAPGPIRAATTPTAIQANASAAPVTMSPAPLTPETSVTIVFPPDVEPGTCRMDTFSMNAAGQVTHEFLALPGPNHEFAISAMVAAQPTAELRAVVECPYRRDGLIDLRSLDGTARRVDVALPIVERVRVRGHVSRLENGASIAGMTVAATRSSGQYELFLGPQPPPTSVERMRFIPGPSSAFTTTTLAADGSFSLDVPDLAGTPAQGSPTPKAGFNLFVTNPTTGAVIGHLLPPDWPNAPEPSLTTQSSYPTVVEFRFHPW